MLVVTCQRLLMKSTLCMNVNHLRNAGIVFLQSRRMLITVFSPLIRKSSNVDYQNLFHSDPQFSIPKKASGSKGIQENISSLQMKKRPLRKKKSFFDEEDIPAPGVRNFYF